MIAPAVNGAVVRVGLLVILGVSLATAGAVLWKHYSGLVEDKATLTAEATGLKAEVAAGKAQVLLLEKTIGSWQEASKAQVRALEENTQAQREAGAYSKELKNAFSKHDLNALALRKPALVESRLNGGTAGAVRLLERASSGYTPTPSAPTPGADSSASGPGKPD